MAGKAYAAREAKGRLLLIVEAFLELCYVCDSTGSPWLLQRLTLSSNQLYSRYGTRRDSGCAPILYLLISRTDGNSSAQAAKQPLEYTFCSGLYLFILRFITSPWIIHL